MRNFEPGDRVVICSTIACGSCSYCRAGYYAQCDNANPNGPPAGTAFFGGPEATRPLRRPAGRVRARPVRARRPGQAARRGHRRPGDPALRHLPHRLLRRGAGRDRRRRHRRGVRLRPGRVVRDRQRAAAGRRPRLRRRPPRRPAGHGARAGRRGRSTSTHEDPVEAIRGSPAASAWTARSTRSAWTPSTRTRSRRRATETRRRGVRRRRSTQVAPETTGRRATGRPATRPSQALRWAVRALAKAGTLAIIGVYPPTGAGLPDRRGDEQEPHDQDGQLQPPQVHPRARRAGPRGRGRPATGRHPARGRPASAIDAYKAFDQRRAGWTEGRARRRARPDDVADADRGGQRARAGEPRSLPGSSAGTARRGPDRRPRGSCASAVDQRGLHAAVIEEIRGRPPGWTARRSRSIGGSRSSGRRRPRAADAARLDWTRSRACRRSAPGSARAPRAAARAIPAAAASPGRWGGGVRSRAGLSCPRRGRADRA